MAYAKASRAWGICDRTGVRYRLKDLVYEINNGQRTGFRVGRDVLDPDHPQNFIGRIKSNDPQALRDPRPDTGLDASRQMWSWAPVGANIPYMSGSVGAVVVTIEE